MTSSQKNMPENKNIEVSALEGTQNSSMENTERVLKTRPFDALIVCSVAMFLMPFMLSAVNIALPKIGIDIQANAVDLGLIATAYMVAVNIFALLTGRISDIMGRRRIFCLGMALFTIASFALVFSSSVGMFTFLRVVQGLAAAMVSTVGMAILLNIFPAKERGKAFGIVTASVYAGVSCGPAIGGIIVDNAGWQGVFLLGAPLGAFSLYIILTRIKDEWREAEGEAFDFRGSFIYATSMICMTIGTALIETESYAWWFIFLGLLILVVFYYTECRTSAPLVNMDIFKKSRPFTLGCLTTWLNFAAVTSLTMFLTFYAQVVLELKPTTTGFILMIQPLIQMSLSPFTGRLADKFSPYRIATFGMGICTIGMLYATTLNLQSSLYTLIIIQVILGVGLASFVPTNALALMNSVEPRYIAIASGIANTMSTLGIVTCMLMMTIAFSLFMHGQAIEPANKETFLQSMLADFAVFALLCFVGLILSYLRQKSVKNL